MNKSSSFYYVLRKSPIVRTLFWVVFIVIFGTVSFVLILGSKKVPEIYEIEPAVGSPGTKVTIRGKNFGDSPMSAYLEMGGSTLTANSFQLWTDSEIQVILPVDFKEGLVYVGNKDSRSEPKYFANANETPSLVEENPESNLPLIISLSADDIVPGSLLTIKGSNFGNSRDQSKVYFTTKRESLSSEKGMGDRDGNDVAYVAVDESENAYRYWSNSEIRVFVPDGAVSGSVYVDTVMGKSANKKISISSAAGKKAFINPKSYLIQISADIEEKSGNDDSNIIIRCPRPCETSYQTSVRLVECNPEAIIEHQKTLWFQVQSNMKGQNRKKFYQNYAMTVYEVRTNIWAAKLNSYENMNPLIVKNWTSADELVPSQHEEIIALAKKIKKEMKAEKNLYNIAASIYNYMISNFTILDQVRSGVVQPLDMLETKKGDAYDFSIVYAALLRASGIPALPDSGVLVDADLKSRNHWWCEFYLPGFGWVPSDPALGAGLEYKNWQKDIEPSVYYFNNLDAQHVLISRGWNEIKPGSSNNQIVSRPRTYALQSIWEEASGNSINYSSFWADPTVIGVY